MLSCCFIAKKKEKKIDRLSCAIQIIYPNANKPHTFFMGKFAFAVLPEKIGGLVEIQENLDLEEDGVTGIIFFTVFSEKPKKLLVWGNTEVKDSISLRCQ